MDAQLSHFATTFHCTCAVASCERMGMSFPLTIIGLPGHFMVKTEKSQLFNKTCDSIGDAAIPPAGERVCIINSNATFHYLQHIVVSFGIYVARLPAQ